MAVVLYRGANQQNPQSYSTAFFDIDGATQGTDYSIQHTSTQTVTGIGTVHYIRLDIGATGIPYIDGINADSSGNIIPLHKFISAGTNFKLDSDATAVTVGVQPDDWNATWWWKYYTAHVETIGGDDYTTYDSLTSSTWSNTTQYYAATDLVQPWYTGNNMCFGVGCDIYWNGNGWQSVINAPGVEDNNRQTGWFKYPGYGGSEVCYEAVPWPQNIEQVAVGSLPKNIVQFVEFDMTDVHYIGLMVVEVAADDTRTGAKIIALSDNIFGSIQPNRKNWGARSGVVGGQGTFDNTPDIVNIPAFPSNLDVFSFGSHGMHMYILDATKVGNLYDALWSDDFFKRWKNYKYNPLEGIISLHMMPLVPSTGTGGNISISGTILPVTATPTTHRIIDSSVYTCKVPEYYGSYFDYAPNTRATIVLPFCGEYPLDISDFMGGSVSIMYRFDLMTGDCVAFVKAENRDGLDVLRKTYAGNAAWRIPVSGNDGGAAGLISALSQITSGGVGMLSGNVVGGGMQLAGGLLTAATAQQHTTAPAVQGNAAGLGNMTPYIKIERAVQLLPENYESTQGMAAPIGGTVGTTSDGYEITGFAQFASVDLSGIPDIDSEEAEALEAILKGGIWL